MDHKSTQDQEERASGVSVAVFSILITVTALLICAIVTLLTVQPKSVSPGGDSGTGTNGGTSEQHSSGPSVPVFTPSVIVLPRVTQNTKTITDISSAYAALVDLETGELYAGKNVDTRFNPASMTKIMTLIVACEKLNQDDLDKTVKMTQEVYDYVRTGIYHGSGSFGFDVGDETTVRALLFGIGVKSAADCTMMIVRYLCDSEQTFVGWMNEEAAAMGLQNTHFENVVGMEGSSHYTTASDMAAILMRALDCPLIQDILSTSDYQFAYAGYNQEGNWTNVPSAHFYSTLFVNRMDAFKKQYGVAFKLKNLTLRGGKTGTLTLYSLASYAYDKSGKTYVLITGDASANYEVLKDAQIIYDGYIQ